MSQSRETYHHPTSSLRNHIETPDEPPIFQTRLNMSNPIGPVLTCDSGLMDNRRRKTRTSISIVMDFSLALDISDESPITKSQ